MEAKIILASASPQRRSLLGNLGVEFDVIPSGVDEAAIEESDPATRAVLLSELKAQDVAKDHPDAYVIGSDTLVVSSEGTLLEKPKDAQEARSMIEMHSGSTSTVHSGLCIVAPGGELVSGLSSSDVTFKDLSADEIDWWIGTEIWQDRSGGFQIDGLGQLMIENIKGDWTSIVGLPVFLLGELADHLDWDFLSK